LVLIAGYLYAGRFVENNSDGAGLILEAQAMRHGNVLLHGWYFGSDPYNTTEAFIDAVGSVFLTGGQLLKVSPAFVYAATLCTAAYLAARCIPAPATRTTRWLAAGACAALVAFPVGPNFAMVQVGSLHMGTILAGLVALVAYDQYVKRSSSLSRRGAAHGELRTAIGAPEGQEATTSASADSSWTTSVSDSVRGHDQAGGGLPTAWSTLGAAVLALLLGLGARQLLIMSGMHIGSAASRLASPELIWNHVVWLVGDLGAFFHIVLWPQMGYAQRVPFIVLNVGFFLVAMAGFALLLRRTLFPRAMRDSLGSVVSWCIVCNIAAFLLTTFAYNIGGLRYLLPTFVCLGILCYLALSEVIARRYLGRYVLAFVAVSGLSCGVMLANAPLVQIRQQPLIAFLQSHHLTVGLGTYWDANITTLRSNGQVRVLAVQAAGGRIHPYYWVVDGAWFDRAQLSKVRFVVTDELANIVPFQAAVTASFGAPDHIYHVGHYTIDVWDRPIQGILGKPIMAP
jgi:hypothetical protein